ncbi:TonB-dependent receptor [Campylobacter sp. PS10]|uniref:TonB-dependent receptor n=1 Tax=Campylobacter gastrosuis TaxID=2974576 RepID=A0ABT7HQ78_9BACT|nr:TonB-dependent receptor [Campylobacter gastrosuis]MDL0088877.1 TonB-dependent receptor [Campylobacter gastrosuis]
MPGFARLDMSGGYNFNKNTQITLAVNNVLNKRYWRSSARAGDERSFMLNLHYNF